MGKGWGAGGAGWERVAAIDEGCGVLPGEKSRS